MSKISQFPKKNLKTSYHFQVEIVSHHFQQSFFSHFDKKINFFKIRRKIANFNLFALYLLCQKKVFFGKKWNQKMEKKRCFLSLREKNKKVKFVAWLVGIPNLVGHRQHRKIKHKKIKIIETRESRPLFRKKTKKPTKEQKTFVTESSCNVSFFYFLQRKKSRNSWIITVGELS